MEKYVVACSCCGANNTVADGIATKCDYCDKLLPQQRVEQVAATLMDKMFCTKCAKDIDKDAVVCPSCGVPTNNYHQQQQQTPASVHVNVSNVNTNTNTVRVQGRPRSKWVALALCFFLGFFGAHKFYEGKAGMGILYIFTLGLFFIGVFIDFIVLLFKPNPYYI